MKEMIYLIDKYRKKETYLQKNDRKLLVIKFSDKVKLKISDKYVALSNLSIYYTGKI